MKYVDKVGIAGCDTGYFAGTFLPTKHISIAKAPLFQRHCKPHIPRGKSGIPGITNY